MEDLSFDPGLLIWTLITFGCLVLLLARFAFKPLTRLLEKREHMISDSLEMAEKANRDAQATLEQNREQLSRAREEARHIIGEGQRIVTAMKEEARQGAQVEAEQVMRQAREDIDREVQRSLDGLKSTVSGLSIRIASQVVKRQLDEQEHERLADEFIERLKKTHAGRKSR